MRRLSIICISAGFAALGIAAAPARPAAERDQPSTRRPNIVVITLDDVGYADLGAFGSEIRTPAIDSIAARGLRYTNFQTKAICSATRASLMTGRNAQTVGMGDLPDAGRNASSPVPARLTGIIPQTAEMLPEALRRVGYATFAVGKWHLTPSSQDGEPGNNSTMPLQRGFDSFYGYKMGFTDQYHPELIEGNDRVPDPYRPGYHLAEDLAQHAITAMKDSQARYPKKPMFLYVSFSFSHTPLQVPKAYVDRYAGTYQSGWDALRQTRFARQQALGIVPATATLPPREAGDPAWSSLTPQQQRVYARFMAAYAGFIEHGDAQIGKVLDYLKASGLDENTVVVLLSDNGAASESKTGTFRRAYGDKSSLDEIEAHLDEMGSPSTQPLYQRPWAYAGSTPFRRYKLWPYSGGVRTPLLIAYPGHIRDAGGLRRQMVDAIDLAPTLLQIAGTRFRTTIDGAAAIPVAGRSILPTLTSAAAPSPRGVQFFELRGNRAIIAGNWRAVAVHRPGSSFDADHWQLFDLKRDPTEATDLSKANPRKVQEMRRLWQVEAARYGGLPLIEMGAGRAYLDEVGRQ